MVSEKDARDYNKNKGHCEPSRSYNGKMSQRLLAKEEDAERIHHGKVMDQGDRLQLNGNPPVVLLNGIRIRAYVAVLAHFVDLESGKDKLQVGDLIDGAKGFNLYTNVGDESTAHNPELQRKRTARIQQPRDHCRLYTEIPGLIEIRMAVEARHPGLSFLYMDFLMQDFTDGGDGATDFRWHVDTDTANNPGGAKIVRTVIVKLTEGVSKMQVAGLDETVYGECAGSWVDFRSAAYHRSVVVPGTKHYKLVFFLGHREDIDDGRTWIDGAGNSSKKKKK